MSIIAQLQETTRSQSDELERIINTERVNLVTLQNSRHLALDRHKLELNQIVTWATELNGDRVRETEAEYGKLIAAAEDRITRLTTLNGAVFEGRILIVAPEHEEPSANEATMPTADLSSLAKEAEQPGALIPTWPAETFGVPREGGDTDDTIAKPLPSRIRQGMRLFANGGGPTRDD